VGMIVEANVAAAKHLLPRDHKCDGYPNEQRRADQCALSADSLTL
jgi:hypothetical protein